MFKQHTLLAAAAVIALAGTAQAQTLTAHGKFGARTVEDFCTGPTGRAAGTVDLWNGVICRPENKAAAQAFADGLIDDQVTSTIGNHETVSVTQLDVYVMLGLEFWAQQRVIQAEAGIINEMRATQQHP
jgi:hypothetical protein